mgnify:CR=1 FL=1
MQIHEEALKGTERPCAPLDCVLCKGARKLHRHGSYERNADCTGAAKAVTLLFICPQCRQTIGVIPRGMLPYRTMKTERLERWLDGECGMIAPASTLGAELAGGDARPPPASEVERGCLLRARKILLQRIPVLCGLLGQQMPVSLFSGADLGTFWRALRKVGRLGEVLVHLGKNFNTSLLRDYRSLQPAGRISNWQRRGAPA